MITPTPYCLLCTFLGKCLREAGSDESFTWVLAVGAAAIFLLGECSCAEDLVWFETEADAGRFAVDSAEFGFGEEGALMPEPVLFEPEAGAGWLLMDTAEFAFWGERTGVGELD